MQIEMQKQEEELKEIKENESRVEIGIDTKHNNMAQLSFPFHDSALTALHNYRQMTCDYVQLSIGNLAIIICLIIHFS